MRGALITLTADITKADDCERVANAVVDRFGRVDALVNAAGIGMQTVRSNYMSEPVRFWEVEPERWQAVMDVNWKGAFLMARAVTPAPSETGIRTHRQRDHEPRHHVPGRLHALRHVPRPPWKPPLQAGPRTWKTAA